MPPNDGPIAVRFEVCELDSRNVIADKLAETIRWCALAQGPNSQEDKRDRDREHAADMLKFVQYQQENLFLRGGLGFRHSVDRLELFSQDLVEQAP